MNAPLNLVGSKETHAALSLDYRLRDFDDFPLAGLLRHANPALYRQCCQIQQMTRTWASEHLLPFVDKWDRIAGQQHDFIPWPAIDAGLKYGFFSMILPKVFGGGGHGPLSSAVFYEEVAAADAGMSVVYGAHALALAAVMSTLDPVLIEWLGHQLSKDEQSGRAPILALAITEPGGGSDVEDEENMQYAQVQSTYRPVKEGFRVTGNKVFISNGAVARHIVLIAWADRQQPTKEARLFIIPHDAKGLSIGRLEHKMGQRLSSAAEIICDDVFVPAKFSHTCETRNVDIILSLTRGPVGAISTGIIRGVLEHTLAYLQHKRVGDHFLYEEQWVQLALAETLADLQTGRGLYLDAALAVEYRGIAKYLALINFQLPAGARTNPLFRQLLATPFLAQQLQSLFLRQVDKAELQRQVGHSSIAKFRTSDLAVKACMRALEILGEDASDPRWGVEKYLRDAKLAQIFEGTNQINQLHVARGFLK